MFSKFKTLKVKFSIITFMTYLLLIVVVLLASYYRFHQNMIRYYKRLGSEVLNVAIKSIDADKIPGYLSGEYQDEYDEVLEELAGFSYKFDQYYHIYAYKLNNDGTSATIIFDANIDDENGHKLGDNYQLDKEIIKRIPILRKGLNQNPLTIDTKQGYIMTCFRPIIDSNGVCQGYLMSDINLTDIRKTDRGFIINLFAIVFTLMCLIFYGGMTAVSKRITQPIEKMYLCLSDFKYDSDTDRKENIDKLKALDIHTNVEIQMLYEKLIKITEDSYWYLHEYQTATKRLGIVTEKAYSDSLTGFFNKNAYEDRIKKEQSKIDKIGMRNMTIIMIDVNNLKYVNDTFGHKRGDEYIKGCCNIISEVCKTSKVYRIGGDEFVIILEGQDYTDRKMVYHTLVNKFRVSYDNKNKQPWERYSASIGIADSTSQDRTVQDIFKRADKSMYIAKSKFKEKYGSYR